ncbi:hypothetical protein SEA_SERENDIPITOUS_19 [Mycobacterium phage Serendipitous]|uniref:Uncharacterized protein n=1 Tax=Mycobacterium phage Serendipitous TaxID=2301619 RepID=A0A385UG27_9CAUD|nr:hypothetical protein I5G64_gp19 [Mycobacterium phage Serendipitous]AYB70561.1 hypothetical protein SEA_SERENDIPITOUS_19 [Mycobacterium phage Serendipitous]
MWSELITAVVITMTPPVVDAPTVMRAGPTLGSVAEAPYVSCRDGYVAPSLDQCPVIQRHTTGPPIPPIGGGPRRRGLLGLGGVGGLL